MLSWKSRFFVALHEQEVYCRGLIRAVGCSLLSATLVPTGPAVSVAAGGSAACAVLAGYEQCPVTETRNCSLKFIRKMGSAISHFSH